MKLVGKPFGVRQSKHRVKVGVFACECGQNVVLKLNNGHRNTTCGECRNSKNRGVDKKTYQTWAAMKRRCKNKNCADFKHYGARGIRLCVSWEKYDNFLADMGVAPEGMTLDRVDCNGDYCPENCRWATMQTQQNNRRNNRRIEIDGESKTIAEWSRQLGGHPANVFNRLKRGWSERDAVLKPLRRFKT